MDQGTAHRCFCGILWILRHQCLISSEKSVQPCWNARRTVLFFFCRANQRNASLGIPARNGRWNSNKWQWLPPHVTIKMLVKTPFLYILVDFENIAPTCDANIYWLESLYKALQNRFRWNRRLHVFSVCLAASRLLFAPKWATVVGSNYKFIWAVWHKPFGSIWQNIKKHTEVWCNKHDTCIYMWQIDEI